MLRTPSPLVASLALGLFTLALYVVTLYPSIPGGDSGELIVAAQTVASAHPTGYPLYVLLAKGFTWLPFEGPRVFQTSR